MVIYNRTDMDLYIPADNDGQYSPGESEYQRGFNAGYTSGYTDASATSVNLTQEEYDALEEKPCNVYFNIIEED